MKIEIVDSSKITWQQLKALRLEAVQNYPLSFAGSYVEDLAHSYAYWENLLNSIETKHVFALADGKLIGSVSYYHHNLAKIRHLYHLCAMYVTLDYQNSGVGRQLVLSALESIKKDSKAHKVTLAVGRDNLAGLALYKGCGFREVGIQEDELFVDGCFYDEISMEQILN